MSAEPTLTPLDHYVADVLEGRIHVSDAEYEGLAAEAYARSPSLREHAVARN